LSTILTSGEEERECRSEKVANIVDNKLLKGLEPETSGGLLLVLDSNDAEAFEKDMHAISKDAWIIGTIVQATSEDEKVKVLSFE